MANHPSAKKRQRQNLKRRTHNRTIRSAARTAMKKTRLSVASGNKEEALDNFRKSEQALASAATKGLFHPKNVQRKISRLAKLVNSL